jgi:hypothetical protein
MLAMPAGPQWVMSDAVLSSLAQEPPTTADEALQHIRSKSHVTPEKQHLLKKHVAEVRKHAGQMHVEESHGLNLNDILHKVPL